MAPQAILPLHPDHGLHPNFVPQVLAEASIFDAVLRGKRPAGRLFRDDEMARFAFTWHRGKAIRVAMMALRAERKTLGDDFDLDKLRGRELPYLLTSEAAGAIGSWTENPDIAGATGICSSLRSAYWLWLEDDNRAMGVLRTALEQTARLRRWRLRPDKAAALQANPRTTPRDWLDAAGWRRLEALNRGPGELVHARPGSSWLGALELLTQLQPGEAPSLQTARGFCLDLVTQLAAGELALLARVLSAPLGPAFAEILLDRDVEVDS